MGQCDIIFYFDSRTTGPAFSQSTRVRPTFSTQVSQTTVLHVDRTTILQVEGTTVPGQTTVPPHPVITTRKPIVRKCIYCLLVQWYSEIVYAPYSWSYTQNLAEDIRDRGRNE